jgi:hypothetical protein
MEFDNTGSIFSVIVRDYRGNGTDVRRDADFEKSSTGAALGTKSAETARQLATLSIEYQSLLLFKVKSFFI